MQDLRQVEDVGCAAGGPANIVSLHPSPGAAIRQRNSQTRGRPVHCGRLRGCSCQAGWTFSSQRTWMCPGAAKGCHDRTVWTLVMKGAPHNPPFQTAPLLLPALQSAQHGFALAGSWPGKTLQPPVPPHRQLPGDRSAWVHPPNSRRLQGGRQVAAVSSDQGSIGGGRPR